jgi:poly-gamma-glutamate capsule biosynthesis protein CapA/YwtB (metallophosphatase superfamily)
MDIELIIAIAAAAAAIVIVSQHWNDHEFKAYYGDGGRALYPRLLLNARKDFFKEVT